MMDLLLLLDVSTWPHSILLQVPTPKVASPEVDLLKSQLEFLKSDHARLSADFIERMKQLTAQSESVGKDVETYLSRVFALTALATTLGGGFAIWFGFQTKKEVEEQVNKRLSQVVAETVDREIQLVRRSITREQVITKTSVDYFLKDGPEQTREIELIRTRGFGQIRFCGQLKELQWRTSDLVVVDLEHWLPEPGKRLVELPDARKEQLTEDFVGELLKELPGVILIVYVNDRIPCLNKFPNNRVIMVGSEVSLIGNLADAAYVIAPNVHRPSR